MLRAARTLVHPSASSRLDRALSIFAEVRSGEGVTAVLMLANIFLLLVCYSVIKTVREPLILLGGGAEVRSYAAAGQAMALMALVPLYGWFATRVDRAKLLTGITLFFVATIELFAFAVAAHVPYVGVAFFVWVGIFNMSLIAQFWSFASDIYTQEAGDRIFPIVMLGMTAGAPLGSFIAARLFRSGITPQLILQISAALLALSIPLYLWIDSREERTGAAPAQPLAAGDGFRLVLRSRYLGLIALLVVLLNLVNTTGEYLVARLLTIHVSQLAALNASFDKQAYIGAFSGEYQLWVNVAALLLQAVVTSRLVKHQGLRGALLALPLIALGGYAIVGAGVGFSVVRWLKTAENATDYSIMNTARQLLWLPTTREEKYKAKQAIDTFFVRSGDVLSAIAVYVGAGVLQLGVQQFAIANTMLTCVWIAVALTILRPGRVLSPAALRTIARVAAVLLILAVATPAFAQATREEQIAAEQAEKATRLHPYRPDSLERRLQMVDDVLSTERPVYPYIGTAFDGGGLAIGPGYRGRYGDTGAFDAHAAWSVKNYKAAEATVRLPELSHGRISMDVQANWLDAPDVAFYGLGNDSRQEDRVGFSYKLKTVGVAARVQAGGLFAFGGGFDALQAESGRPAGAGMIGVLAPTYRRSRVYAEIDSRTSPRYTRHGGLYRVEWFDYRQSASGTSSFGQVEAEVRQFVPIVRENSVIALRALATSTTTAAGHEVPFFLLPDLGGSHMLRGYPSWRFRDRNRLLVSGEYRWTAGRFVDMAMFIDAGKVAPRARDLDWRNLTKTYGVGVTLHTFTTAVTRIDLARTPEGMGLVFSVSPSF